ncbi:MAG: hypothetical protein JWN04_4306 [Myxococcaceae bacterium]|nr:hypothetical protein [Myxococcaceae bacterium]
MSLEGYGVGLKPPRGARGAGVSLALSMKSRRSQRLQTLLLMSLLLGCGGTSASVRPATAAPLATTAAIDAPVHAVAAPAASSVAPLWRSVENPDARYIAVLGLPTAHDDSVTEEHLVHARRLAAQTLQSFDEVELAPAHFDRTLLLAESARRKLPGVAFECGVTRHEVDARGTHFSVNVTVVDLRTEDIVATLTGSATAPGPTSSESEQSAMEGALEGAMRGVPKLLASLETVLVAER